MGNRLLRVALSATIIMLTAAGVAACTAGSDQGSSGTGVDAEISNPSETPAESAVVEIEPIAVGTVVDADTPAAEGQAIYAASDGTSIVVDASQPLPENVKTDIVVRAQPHVNIPADQVGGIDEAINGIRALGDSVPHKVIFLNSGASWSDQSQSMVSGYGSLKNYGSEVTGLQFQTDEAAAVAAAQELAAKDGAEVIVLH